MFELDRFHSQALTNFGRRKVSDVAIGWGRCEVVPFHLV